MSSAVDFADWLNEQLRELGITRRELAQAMEVSEGALYSWLASPDVEHWRRISPVNADRMAAALGVHPNDVRDVAGLPRRRSGSSFMPVNRQERVVAVRVIAVPVIGIAPANSLRYTAVVGEMVPVPLRSIQDMTNPQAVIVTGDCLLSRGVHDGDYLILETDPDAMCPKDGDIVIVRVDDEVTVREWMQVDDRVLLRPNESGQKTLALEAGDDKTEIIGAARSVLSSRKL